MANTKMFVHYSKTKAEFIAAGLPTQYHNSIVFIKGDANGVGSCIYTHGTYFANFAEFIDAYVKALNYVKGVNVNGTNYNAAAGGGYVAFSASDPTTVAVNAGQNGITIGLTEAFINKVSSVGSTSDAAAADGSAFARIAQLASDVAALGGDQGAIAKQIEAAITALDLPHTYDAIGAAATVKEAVIGKDGDAASADTIKGAKKYADAAVAAMAVAAEGDTLVSATPNGKKVTVAATQDLKAAVAKANASASATDLAGEVARATAAEKAAKTVVNSKAEGHVIVTVTEGSDKNSIVTITESGDIASAQVLSGVDGRVAAIEAVMGGDDADKAINKVSEIITFLNGIEEGTVAKDTFDAVTAHGTAITNLQNNTVNGKKISENPVLAGSDVLLTGYTAQSAAPLVVTDTINAALGKLEARVDAAAAGGVQSVGGKAGSITLDTDATGEGNVKFAISEDGEISATVNIGATAAQGVNSASGDDFVSASFAGNVVTVAATGTLTAAIANANSAVQTVAEGATNGSIAVDGKDVAVHGLGSAAYTAADAYDAAGSAAAVLGAAGDSADKATVYGAKAYADLLFAWEEL